MSVCRPKDAAKAIRKRFGCKDSATTILTLKVLPQFFHSVFCMFFNFLFDLFVFTRTLLEMWLRGCFCL